MRSRPITILFYIGSLWSGGAERQLVYTAIEAEKRGYRTIIVTDDPKNNYQTMLHGSSITMICTRTSKRTPIKRLYRLLHIIHKQTPDVVHSFLATKNCWAMLCAYLLRVPVRIASVRNCNKTAFTGIKFYSKLATSIIFNTNRAKEIAIKEYSVPKKKTFVIHNGLDLIRFGNNLPLFRIGKTNGLMIGRITPQKNHTGLIEALRLLTEQEGFIPFTINFCGNIMDNRLLQELNTLIKQYKLERQIQYLGQITDIPDLLAKSDFLILPSLYEGFPNVVMEAMASKTFVIATAVGGTPELVKNMENGILITTTSGEDIAKAIKLYLSLKDEEKNRIINQAYTDIQKYSIKKMFEETEKLY